MSQAGPDRVPAESDSVLTVVHQFENVMFKLEK